MSLSDESQHLLLTVEQAGRMLGLGRSKTYELVLKRELASLRVGRRRLVPRRSLEEFVVRRLEEEAKPIKVPGAKRSGRRM